MEGVKDSIRPTEADSNEVVSQGLNSSLHAQQRGAGTMDEVHSVSEDIAQIVQTIGGIAGQVAQDVDASVRNLQFQDLSNQLLEHIRRQGDSLDLALECLTQLLSLTGEDPTQIGGGDGIQQAAGELELALEQVREIIRRTPAGADR